jgi:hypothetical protein
MITVNLLQPKVAFPLYLLSDLPQVSHSRSFAQPAPKIKFPGVQSSSPSPRLREFLLGKSPLRLVVKRTWHSRDSFTDVLECGHESQLQFTAFGYVEDQYLHRIQPTAKRRRCQECKDLAGSGRKQISEKLIKGSPARVPLQRNPTREPVPLMGIHATPKACSGGDADTVSILGGRSETGETGDCTASGRLSHTMNDPDAVPDRRASGNLYDSCREILNSPPKKSPKRAA